MDDKKKNNNNDDALDKATRLNSKFKVATTGIGAGFGAAMCSSFLIGLIPSTVFVLMGFKWAGSDNVAQLTPLEFFGSLGAGSALGMSLAYGIGVNDVIDYDLAANEVEADSAYVQVVDAPKTVDLSTITVPKLKAA